jgi:hypothetical protein
MLFGTGGVILGVGIAKTFPSPYGVGVGLIVGGTGGAVFGVGGIIWSIGYLEGTPTPTPTPTPNGG